MELSRLLRRMSVKDREQISEREIDQITSLVSDPDPTVSGCAVDSLGYVGRRAERAAPAVRAYLAQVQAEEKAMILKPSVSKTIPAYLALESITGESPPTGVIR